MGKLLLGIDIGTSACKVAVFDEDGRVLAQASRDYRVYYPKSGRAEQDPEEWWSAICEGIKEVLSGREAAADEICGIGVDGQEAGRRSRWTGTERCFAERRSGWTPEPEISVRG